MWQLKILVWRPSSREPWCRTPFMEANDISVHPAAKWSLAMVPHTFMDLRPKQLEVPLPIILLLSMPLLPILPFGLVRSFKLPYPMRHQPTTSMPLSIVPTPQVYRSWQPHSCDWPPALFQVLQAKYKSQTCHQSVTQSCTHCSTLSQTPQAPIEKSSYKATTCHWHILGSWCFKAFLTAYTSVGWIHDIVFSYAL